MIKRSAYTLLEVLLVMLLLSILTTGILTGIKSYVDRGRDASVDFDLKSMNTTIDYLKEKKGRLPNLAEIREEMGQHGFKYNLKTVIVSEVEGELFLTIRAETTQHSKYNMPYSLNIIARYNNEFGVKNDGDFIEITKESDGILNFNAESITMIVLDNILSGVPEIIWLN